MANRWLEGNGDPRADVRAALEGVAAVYAEHGLVLGAIADAAGHDPEVESDLPRPDRAVRRRDRRADRGRDLRNRRRSPALDAARDRRARSCG